MLGFKPQHGAHELMIWSSARWQHQISAVLCVPLNYNVLDYGLSKRKCTVFDVVSVDCCVLINLIDVEQIVSKVRK